MKGHPSVSRNPSGSRGHQHQHQHHHHHHKIRNNIDLQRLLATIFCLLTFTFFWSQYHLFFSLNDGPSQSLQYSNQHHTVFYNIYVPKNSTDRVEALNIVKEQLTQVKESRHNEGQDIILHYSVIGSTDENSLNIIQSHCRSLGFHCTLISANTNGDESITLIPLQQFCSKSTINRRVTYIHNKGSFHRNEYNDQWRRALTAAALHDDCIDPPDQSCSVCGVQFFTQFSLLFPGNMWTASCSYINMLLPLSEYVATTESVVSKIFFYKAQNMIQSNLFPNTYFDRERKDFYGLDRYGYEHWIASHPYIQPCDLDISGNLESLFNDKSLINKFTWSLAPRHHGFVIAHDNEKHKLVYTNQTLRLKEYYLLPGHLIKWYTYYQLYPTNTSWVWKWFPDGAFWKEATTMFGEYVIDAVASNNRPQAKTSFSGITDIITIDDKSILEKQDWIVIFQITVNSQEDTHYEKQIKLIRKMIEILAKSQLTKHVKDDIIQVYFFINTYSNNMIHTELNELCIKYKSTINCHVQATYEGDYSGESLLYMYNTCIDYENLNIVYLDNNAIENHFINNNGLDDDFHVITDIMKTTLGKDCINAITTTDNNNNNQCNACGYMISFLHTISYTGNIYVTQCKYIQKLIQPNIFENKMNDFNKEILLLGLVREKLTGNIYPLDEKYIGINKYALTYWLGSHPSFTPCLINNNNKLDTLDVSRILDTSIHSKEKDLLYRIYKQETFDKLTNVINSETLRKREYHLLPGILLRYKYLYDILPLENSWIYKILPDGTYWKNVVASNNQNILDITTQWAFDAIQ